MQEPNGGQVDLRVTAGGVTRTETLNAKGERTSKVYSVSVPDGEAQLRLLVKSRTRLFGVSLERDAVGVTYNSLGAHAALAVYWKKQNVQHWKDQMDLRKPALVVLQYGTNESALDRIEWDKYEADLSDVFDMVKTAAPNASVLVMAPMDRSEGPSGKTMGVILKLREKQHKVALAKGFAFWDTYLAMGGEGSMGKWVKAIPQLGSSDYTHPTPAGGEVIADLLMKALTTGYQAYASRHPEAPPLP
jgi:lysophospholipase L1-like esterase